MIALFITYAFGLFAAHNTYAYQSPRGLSYSFDQINTQHHESAYFSARNQLRQSYAEREYAFQLTQLQQDYHRSLYAPSPLPPGFCDNFSTMRWWEEFTTTYGDFAEYCKEWQNFVRKHNFSDKEKQYHERARMRRWNHYGYVAYHQFLRTLSVYDDYFPEIAHQYRNDHEFAAALQGLFPDLNFDWNQFFTQELNSINQRKTMRALQAQQIREHQRLQQQFEPIKTNYEKQLSEVNNCLEDWNQRCPQRVQAYYATNAEQGQATRRSYKLVDGAQRLVYEQGYDHRAYHELVGNTLQHQLMQEITIEVNALSRIMLPQPKDEQIFVSVIRESAVKALHYARKTNEIGHCANSSKLLDVGQGLGKYVDAIIAGAQHGSFGYVTGSGLITEAEQVATELARIQSIPREVVLERINNVGQKLGYSPQEIACVIERFDDPKINVSIERFTEGIARFQDTPNGTNVIKQVFKHTLNPDGFNRANGFLYELASTSILETVEQDSILSLAFNIGENEHDFMTARYLGECKNVYWPGILEGPRNNQEIRKLIIQLEKLKKHAGDMQKKPVLITRHPIPHGWVKVLQLLVNLGIEQKVGY